MLPESVTCHAGGGDRGNLPGTLERTVIAESTVCMTEVRIRNLSLTSGSNDLHSSKRQGLLAVRQAAAWSVIHLLPQV